MCALRTCCEKAVISLDSIIDSTAGVCKLRNDADDLPR